MPLVEVLISELCIIPVVCDCHHICVSSSLHDNHTQCLCSDGYQLSANKKTCLRMATAAAPGFVYSLGDRSASHIQMHLIGMLYF